MPAAVKVTQVNTFQIVGPIAQVRRLFNRLGLQAIEQNLPGCTSVLFGYYPCDSPPQVGYQFGAANPTFEIEASAFKQADDGGNNCTAIITGIDLGAGVPLWIVGQAWFQGKYVDFNDAGKTVGVAQLRDKTGCAGVLRPE